MNEIIFNWFNSLAGPSTFFDNLTIFTAEWLGWLMLASFVIYLLSDPNLLWQRRRSIGVIFSAAISAWLITAIIKFLYVHPRPFAVLSGVRQLIAYQPDNSFPSSHSTFFLAFGLAVYLQRYRRLGVVYIIGALLIGLARIIGGIHWPADVLIGWIIGGLVAHSFQLFHRQRTLD